MRREIRASSNKEPLTNFRARGGTAVIRAEDAADGTKKLPTFSGNAYTGAPMTPNGWWGVIICDLSGVVVSKQLRPALHMHDEQQIVGHTTSILVDDSGVQVQGLFSGQSENVAKITDPAKNGFEWQLSIGAIPIRTEFVEAGKTATVNGREVVGPITISRETELKEISFVPLGADDSTSVTVSASTGKGKKVMKGLYKTLLLKAFQKGLVKAGKYSAEDIDKMDEKEAKAALKETMSEDGEKTEAEDGEEEDDDEEEMTEAEEEGKPKAKAKSSSTKAAIQASRKQFAAEMDRQAKINQLAAKSQVIFIKVDGQDTNLFAHAIQKGWSVDKTELEALRASRPGPGVGTTHLHLPNAPQVSEAVLEAAVLHACRHQLQLQDDSFYYEPTPDGKGTKRRVSASIQRETQGAFAARYTDQVQQSAHTLFKGRVSLHRVMEVAFRAAGSTSALDFKSEEGLRAAFAEWGYREQGFRADGASSISLSNVLSNVMNKFALQGYLFTEQTWRKICAIRPVNDFKPTKSINLLGDVMFKQIGSTGELESATLSDQAFANQAAPFGRIMTIPWTNIINDDLSILSTLPTKLGSGAGLALNDAIWTLWKAMAANSVNGDDGVSFWRTTQAIAAANMKAGTAYKPNKLTGAGSALSAAALQLAKALFDNQIDPNGNPLGFDGLTPVLLHGPSNWQAATSLMQAVAIVYGGASAALQPNSNVWQGTMEPAMSRYIEAPNYVNSATAWWILFNPVAMAAIEVAFLNGVDTPAVLQAGPDYQFDRLGITIRGTMPFGANAQNFRGGVYAVGA